jgi:O-antigen ligase
MTSTDIGTTSFATAASLSDAATTRRERVEWFAAVAILAFVFEPLFDVLTTLPGGQRLATALWAVLYLLAVTMLVRRFSLSWIVWTARHMPAVLLVLLMAILSSAWSPAPDLTLRRSLALVGTTLVGLYLGLRFSPQDLMRALFWAMFLLTAVSAVVATLLPHYGTMAYAVIDRTPEAWKGILISKQGLGAVAAYGGMVCVAMLFSRDAGRMTWLAVLAFFALVCLMSKSATAYAALPAAAAATTAIVALRQFAVPGPLVRMVTFIAMVVLGFLATTQLGNVAEVLGRDPSLTGRTATWAEAIRLVEDRPLTGHGFEAADTTLFLPGHRKAVVHGHAHNGFLTVATQMGVPAAVLALGLVLFALHRALSSYFSEPSAFARFAVGYLLLFVAVSVTRSSLFMYESPDWVLFMAVTATLIRVSSDQVHAASAASLDATRRPSPMASA